MAAGKRKKLEVLTIECGWNSCGQEFDNNWDLNTHIEQHLSTYKPKNPKSGIHICLWVNCDFDTDCIKEFHRHMYFHGYYEDLLVQGKHVCDTHPSVPKCTALEMTTYRIPALKEDFRCQWTDCERTFSSVVEFQDHIVQHASFEYEIQKSPDDERPKTQCNWHFCNKQLENKYRLIEHIRTHTNKKQLACYNCGETFRTKTTLFDHLKRQPENNTQNYQCAQCFKYFATERLLKLHVIKHVNCYKCTMCDMTCSSASSLATHIRYRHLKDKPFECDVCQHRCVRKSDLARHKQNVHSKELHSCAEPGCQYTVKSYEQMRRHFLEVHADHPFIYACHCCEKCFKNGKSLSQHLMKTHDFQLPSGHKRFTYRVDENGIYRLETMRIESLEVSQQILTPNPFDAKKAENTAFEIKNLTKTGNIERIVVTNDSKDAQPMSEIVISLPNMVEL